MRVVADESGLPARGMAVALIDLAYRTPHRSMPATAGRRDDRQPGNPALPNKIRITLETLTHNTINNAAFGFWPSLR
jgi:hypothetical protein